MMIMKIFYLSILLFLVVNNVVSSDNTFKVISILPNDQNNFTLSFKSPITVVFNRPVIKLGEPSNYFPFILDCGSSKIKGKYHWVTTSICRFDIDDFWPSNINCKFYVDPMIQTYDLLGLSNTTSPPPTISYTSDSPSISISDVYSNKNSEMTDNHWEPNAPGNLLNGTSVNLFEVPPDGYIQLEISHGFDFASLNESIKILKEERKLTAKSMKFNVMSCDDIPKKIPPNIPRYVGRQISIEIKSRVCIQILDPLETGQIYKIVFPVGSKIHSNSGPLPSTISLNFMGLYPFTYKLEDKQISSKNLRLFHRHSLNESVSLDMIQNAFVFSPKVKNLKFSFPARYSLEFFGDFKPNQNYRVTINGSEDITDGWGLSLKSHQISFTTYSGANYIFRPPLYQTPIFDSFESVPGYYTLYQNIFDRICYEKEKEKPLYGLKVSGYPITKDNLEHALLSYASNRIQMNEEPLSSMKLQFHEINTLYINTLPLKELFIPSSCYLHIQQQCSDQYEMQFVSKGDISVSSFSSYGESFSVWVSKSSKPYKNMPNALVSYYSYGRNDQNIIENVTLVAYSNTNKHGVAELEIKGNNSSFSTGYLTVQYGTNHSKIFITPHYLQSNKNSNVLKSELITDRYLYKPSETIYFKGYLRGPNIGKYKFTLRVYWRQSQISIPFEKDIINIDPIYGSFSMEIPIPMNVDRGSYSLEIQSDSYNDYAFYSSKMILISDSKLPTGIIKLESSQPFIPLIGDGSPLYLTVNVSTQNYLGFPQPNQKVTLNWKTPTENLVNPGGDYFKRFKFASNDYFTDSEGKATIKLEFNPIDIDIDYGDSIHIEATYIDQTGTKILSPPLSKVFINSLYLIKLSSNPLNGEAPGVPEPIYAQIVDISNSSYISNINVTLKLQQYVGKSKFSNLEFQLKIANQDNPFSSGNQEFCKAKSKPTIGKPDCYYTLPEMGRWVIIASAIAPNGETIQSTLEVGKTHEEWNANPWKLAQDSMTIYTNKEFYSEGEEITFEFYNLFKDSKLLIQYGCPESGNKFKEFDSLPYGITKLNINSPPLCSQTLSISGVHVSREVGFTLTSNFPTSLQDYSDHAFHFKTISQLVSIRQKGRLTLSLNTDRVDYTPGSNGTITLKITDKKSKQPYRPQLEACLYIIDKRNLDLSPNPLATGKSLSSIDSYSPLYVNFFSKMIKNYYNTVQKILNRLLQDKFLGSYTNFDLSESELYKTGYTYLNQYFDSSLYKFSRFGTYGTFSFNNPYAAENILAEGDSSIISGSESNLNDLTVNVRDFFKTTPLFVGKVLVSGGITRIPFKLPDDVTTFEIRAYVIDSENTTSKFEFLSQSMDIISKREFSIQPIAPSFVRVGDTFEAGISLIYNNLLADLTSGDEFRLSVKIDSQSLHLLSPSTVQQINPTGFSTNVFYNFTATSQSTSESCLYFNVYQNSKLVDSVKIELIVLSKQVPIYVGTSMMISNNSVSSEGIELPDSEPGSGTFNIFAGVGRYPAVEEKSTRLLSIKKERTLSSIDLLSQQVTFGALTAYHYNTSLIELSKEALMQVVNGFSSYISYNKIKWYPNVETNDCYPTLYFLMLEKLLDKTKIGGWSVIGTDNSVFEQYLDQVLNSLVEGSVNSNTTVNKELIGQASIALGYYWSPDDDDLVDLYSWNSLTSNITDNCSLMCQTYYTIAAILRGEGDSKFIPLVIKNLENSIRIQGRTAYISENPSSTISSNPLTIYGSLALILSNYTNTELLEKLINFIAFGGVQQNISPLTGKDFPYPIGFSSENEAISLIVLTLYDKKSSSNSPDLNFTIYQNQPTNILIRHRFTPTTPQPLSEVLKFNSLYSTNGTIFFKSEGSGEISSVIGLEYTPNEPLSKPIYSGVNVEKVIIPLNGNQNQTRNGQGELQFTLGQEVKIIISVTTNDDISDLFIYDSIAGGLSPLDSLVYGEDDINPYSSMNYDSDRFPMISNSERYLFYQPFQYKETRSDRIIFHAESLSVGSYQVEYNAIVTTVGRFIIPPTKSYSSNQPEFFGLSQSTFIQITK